jgi:predicted RNA methylase
MRRQKYPKIVVLDPPAEIPLEYDVLKDIVQANLVTSPRGGRESDVHPGRKWS